MDSRRFRAHSTAQFIAGYCSHYRWRTHARVGLVARTRRLPPILLATITTGRVVGSSYSDDCSKLGCKKRDPVSDCSTVSHRGRNSRPLDWAGVSESGYKPGTGLDPSDNCAGAHICRTVPLRLSTRGCSAHTRCLSAWVVGIS